MGTQASGGGTRWAFGPAALLEGLRTALRRRRVYRQTLRELRALSRRELEDRGIGPGMITRVAAEAAYGKSSPAAGGRGPATKD